MEQAPLMTPDAVLLAHGLLSRLADRVGARVLFLKGPTATASGARPDRSSSDVDVLVDPASFDAMCAAIEGLGWTRRFAPLPVPRTADVAFDHSAHFIHPQWPCDLDVHYLFPGFLADPATVFDALWAARREELVAEVRVPTLDLVGHALVVGLHALRDPDRTNSPEDLAHLAAFLPSALDEAGRAALVERAAATGSSGTAQPVLELAGVEATDDGVPSPALEAWRLRQDFGTVSGAMWLVELRRAPWRARPGVIGRAVLPPRGIVMSSHLAQSATRRQVARAHLRRWARGVRALPQALTVLSRPRSGRL